MLFAGHHLPHDMRVGDVRAGHADHVELAFGDRVTRGCDIRDARRVEDGKSGLGPDLAREVEMRRRPHAGDGDDIRQGRVGLDMAADDVEEIDLARRGEAPCDLDALRTRQAAVPILVRHHANANDEVRSHGIAHRVDHQVREAHPVFERAAEQVGTAVGRGRPERVHQVAVGFKLDPVEAGGLHALRGRRVIGDDALYVPILGLFGKGPVRRLAHRRGRQDRQPVSLVPAGTTAEMGELDHHLAVVLVAGRREFGKPRHDRVVPGMEIAEGGRAVARDQRRTGRHRQRDAALRLFGVIEAIPFLGQAVLGIGGLMRRRHQPVLEGQVPERIGLEKRISGHDRRPSVSEAEAGDSGRDWRDRRNGSSARGRRSAPTSVSSRPGRVRRRGRDPQEHRLYRRSGGTVRRE